MAQRGSLKTEVVRIGNSMGIRIPKSIREQIGLEKEITLSVSGGALIVRPERGTRADWRERFARAKPSRHDEMLIPENIGTDLDFEWTW